MSIPVYNVCIIFCCKTTMPDVCPLVPLVLAIEIENFLSAPLHRFSNEAQAVGRYRHSCLCPTGILNRANPRQVRMPGATTATSDSE